MKLLIVVLFFIPALVNAQSHFDGIYITGGGFISDLQVDFLGVEDNIKDNRPMVFVGYGKTSKPLTQTMRMFVGIEGFYMGESEKKRGSVNIVESEVINEKEDITTVKIGESSTEKKTITRGRQDKHIETRTYTIKQGDTWGGGVRVGLSDRLGKHEGVLYLLAGYANTSLNGQGEVRNALNVVTTTIPKQKVDFGGYYYGIGYEYLFTRHLGLRADYIAIDYSSENFISLRGNSMRSKLEQSGLFLGLSGRF